MATQSQKRPRTPGALAKALNNVALPRKLVLLGEQVRARVGMTGLARSLDVSRTHLYKALSEDGNPELETFLAVLRALELGFYLRHRSTRPSVLAERDVTPVPRPKTTYTPVYVDDRPLDLVFRTALIDWRTEHRRAPDIVCHPTYLERIRTGQSAPTIGMFLHIVDAIDMDLRVETRLNFKRRQKRRADQRCREEAAAYRATRW